MKIFFISLALLLASVTGHTQTPFDCSATMYLSNGTKLYAYSPSGSMTELFEVGNINALAFSTTGLLWAFDQTNNTVVIIDADGNKTPIAVAGLPTAPDYNVGAIDTSGYYYLYDGQASGRFYIIDTDPNRTATYGQLVNPNATGGVVPYALDTRSPKGTVISPTANGGENRRIFSDWTVSPLDGMLYAVTNDGSYRPNRLVYYNPVTGDLTEVTGPISGGTPGFQTNSS